ncbi:MAG: hypothetical protein IJH61_00985 [Eubacteriaceae bacterium]|nr:hypothetical protein [Eubacteriaceae bacterium]
MYTIKLMNEYLHGPIWVYDEEGFIRRKYPLIDNDEELKALNEQARILYDSFYSFNEGESSCSFDESGYQASFDEMCGIIQKIVSKLQTINNGDFVVEDYITKAPND